MRDVVFSSYASLKAKVSNIVRLYIDTASILLLDVPKVEVYFVRERTEPWADTALSYLPPTPTHEP